jgi:chromosome segregation ATPase
VVTIGRFFGSSSDPSNDKASVNNDAFSSSLRDLETELASVAKQKKELELHCRTVERKLEHLEKDNVNVHNTLQNMSQKFNETEKDLGIARIDLKEAKRKNEESEENVVMMKARIHELQVQLERDQGAESPTKLNLEIEQLRHQLKLEEENTKNLKENNMKLKQVKPAR